MARKQYDSKSDTRVICTLDSCEALLLEDYQFNNRIRSRAEAVRRLIRKGLAAEETVNVERS